MPTRDAFGTAPDGTPVERFTFSNARGVEISVITFGGIIVSLRTPDRDGVVEDLVLGHDDVEGYLRSASYFGAIVGRYANRIARGRFTLDGVEYRLAQNNGRNHLHGGERGFDKVVWSAEPFAHTAVRGVALRYQSADGEEGYPGALTVLVTYALTDNNHLVIDYKATTTLPTPVNLSQHTYWNLAGSHDTDVLAHELTINASHFTPVDDELVPTGAIASVEATPFDFRTSHAIGERIDDENDQLRIAGGYDHNYVLDRSDDGLGYAATAFEPVTGRIVDVYTTEPGVQLYTGNFLGDHIRGKGGRVCRHRGGFCLETQHFPDSPNQPHFPSTVLRPGRDYRSSTVFTFGVRDRLPR